ncbi:MFS transporter [Mesorhizobium sp.]|uniref:MFS transporter n=1 Tax=Mesorhizobium sp. TaxID=1871066 RepID=UPI00257EEDED|nr:MFS transporter [Mesorhizobium sp.]
MPAPALETLLGSLRRCLEGFPDKRHGLNVMYPMADIGMAAFSVFFMQSPSFLSHQRRLEAGHGRSNCESLFGLSKIPSDNHIRDMLDAATPELLNPMFAETVEFLRRSEGGLDDFRRLGGRLLIALDGTEYHCSKSIHCRHCSRRLRGAGKGKRGETEYFHAMLAASLVAPGTRQGHSAGVAVGLVSAVLYLPHARRAKNPLLALELFRNQVFRASVLGGGLFRIGIGAVPFLLPLMFQIGFGLTPFQSGMITFVAAIGAIGMKFVTALIFRVAGFRRVLIFGSLIAAASIAINGLLTPETPYLLILAILLAGGFIRSMFFTGINALAYAEISTADTSRATPIAAVFQQLSIALGVALAGGVLEVSTTIHGGALTLSDFHVAFFIVAAVSAAASLSFMRLAPDAGNAVSGHGGLTAPKTLGVSGPQGG